MSGGALAMFQPTGMVSRMSCTDGSKRVAVAGSIIATAPISWPTFAP